MIRDTTYRTTLRHFLAPVLPYLDDDSVREIMINGPDEVYVERKGRIEQVEMEPKFQPATLHAAVTNIAQFAGERLDEYTGRFDARLPDGHRVHVVLPPLSRKGISVTIRKHTGDALTMDALVHEHRSLTPEAAEYLAETVRTAKNVLVSGGTGTGKTTFLNALSAFIPEDQRILTIEDAAELQLQKPHVVSLQTRPPDRKGRGAVTIRDLVHSALRMRPDRIIVGECRGGEALDMLQAMNTGHPGSMTTIHADSAPGALERLETLSLFAGFEIPVKFLRAQIVGAIHVIVQLYRLDGRRLVQSIQRLDTLGRGEVYETREVFKLDEDSGQLEDLRSN